MTTTTPFPAAGSAMNRPTRCSHESGPLTSTGASHYTRVFEPHHRSRSTQPIMRSLALGWLLLGLVLITLAAPVHADYTKVNGHSIYYELHGDLASGETPVLLNPSAIA